jgi:hypothetical protein
MAGLVPICIRITAWVERGFLPIVMARLVRATYFSTLPREVARTSRAMTIGNATHRAIIFAADSPILTPMAIVLAMMQNGAETCTPTHANPAAIVHFANANTKVLIIGLQG